jgi:hypothetical protein
MAYDVVGMFRGFHRDGMIGDSLAIAAISELLGRPLRTYEEYAQETAIAD